MNILKLPVLTGAWWKRKWEFIIEPKHSNAVVAIFSVLLFIATASYTVFAALQWSVMTQSNGVAREGLESVQRAFAFVNEFEPTRLADPLTKKADGMRFVFHWENGGTTPTKDMSTHISHQWRQDALPSDFDFPDLWQQDEVDKAPYRLFVGPKSVSRAAPPIIVPRQEIAAIQNHNGHLYFWGWGRYKDVFPNTLEHITRFCTEIAAVTGDLDGPTVNIQTVNCSRGNCYDEECSAENLQ